MADLSLDSQSPNKPTEEAALTGLKILVVDDVIDNRRLIGRFLEIGGANVDMVTNGHEAISAALSKDYDAVIMDIQMPELDGYEATKHLRKLGYAKPIIALTAHAMKEENERCLRAGFDRYLSKPVLRRDLIASIVQVRFST